jgi:hypothetical protein
VIISFSTGQAASNKGDKAMITFNIDGAGLGIDGNVFETDVETLSVLNGIFPSAKASGDYSAVFALMFFGIKAGIIRKVS